MNKNPTCPKCNASDVIKSGKVKGKQRFKCKSCSYQFTQLIPRGRPVSEKILALTLYIHGLSMNAIAKIIKVSTPAVFYWIRDFAKKIYQKPEPGDAILIEIDEM